MTAYSDDVPSYMRYWGKAKSDPEQAGADYHLLPYHCLDVAAVCYEWLNADKALINDISELLGVPTKSLITLLSFFMALHDVGKFASAFQALAPQLSPELISPNRCKSYNGRDYRHDRLGTWFWQQTRGTVTQYCVETNALKRPPKSFLNRTLNTLMGCMLGHHGVPVEADPPAIAGFTEPCNIDAVHAFTVQLLALFQPEFPEPFYQKDEAWWQKLKQVSWHIAGVAVLCDWIGSNQADFPFCTEVMSLDEYWGYAKKQALSALQEKQLIHSPTISPFSSVKDLFSFEPTPLQAWAEQVELTNTPQLFILEDVTGAGKTEAALTLTHRLMQQGVADGFYFGLPTMATSNAMFERVAAHYLKMYAQEQVKPSIVLAHGAREMNPIFQHAVIDAGKPDSHYQNDEQTASAECHHWLADSRKKALLAPVGVGTIDQALLAVLPKRHQSLRLLGLHRKVLIFDEVHAADEYVFELLDALLQLHFHQGGSVILLTATLPLAQRQKLVSAWQKAIGSAPETTQKNGLSDFPLATHVAPGRLPVVHETNLASRDAVCREVKVTFAHHQQDCLQRILQAVEQGQCVVWVRNSVDDALEAYKLVAEQLDEPEHCLLFHSRFTLEDRNRIEQQVLAIFGKHATPEQRCGRVLIATQVFQESLDADCDLMISDLCPIDDLIQRVGRLHRHQRDSTGRYQPDICDQRHPPEVIVHSPMWDDEPKEDWLSQSFRNTSYVYPSAGRLWLGMRELKKLGAIRMPAQARQLIEAVYSDAGREQIPPALVGQEDTQARNEKAKEGQAYACRLKWEEGYVTESGIWGEDDIEINTRLNEREEVQVVLLRVDEHKQLQLRSDAAQFALQLSTIKLAKHKYADRLPALPEHHQPQLAPLIQRYPTLKYRQCWLPQEGDNYVYERDSGFMENPR